MQITCTHFVHKYIFLTKTNELFKKYDTNCDGYIDKTESIPFYVDMLKTLSIKGDEEISDIQVKSISEECIHTFDLHDENEKLDQYFGDTIKMLILN